MIGVVLSLSAAMGFAATAVLAKLAMQYMRATTGTLVSLAVSAVITLAIVFGMYVREVASLEVAAYAWFLLVGIFSFVGGRLLNFIGVSRVGVSRASPIVGASPLVATMLTVTVGGESINTPLALGTVAIIGGLALILSQQ